MAVKHSVEVFDKFSEKDLACLLNREDSLSISLFMPTRQKSRETRQNPVMLKNLLKKAEKKLDQHPDEEEKKAIEPSLEAVHHLLENHDFWQHQNQGLALFIASDRVDAYRLPVPFTEQVVLNRSFHLTPLVPLLVEDGMFYVLSLNLGNVRLFQGSRFALQEATLPDVPRSLDEFLRLHEFDKSLQFQTQTGEEDTGGDRRAVFHGHGEILDDKYEKKQILRFFQNLDNTITDKLSPVQVPLVLLGPEHLIGLYREANHYPYLSESSAKLNPEGLDEKQLHDRAWEAIEPIVRREIKAVENRYRQLKGRNDPKALDNLEEIIPAACYQRVDTLLIGRDQEAWGTFDRSSGEIHLNHESKESNEDLLHLAVVDTLRYGGTVYVYPAEEMPEEKPAVAILR
jgi:hypothetical protein